MKEVSWKWINYKFSTMKSSARFEQ
jgi:hypothetical protein